MRRMAVSLGLIVLGLALGLAPVAQAGGFVFTPIDVPFTIPGFPPPVETNATGINLFGQIVGLYADPNDNIERGYLRNPDGGFTQIDVPGAFITAPRGINLLGVIVGQYRNAPGITGVHCFVSVFGFFFTLDVQGIPNAVNTGCRGINTWGQIVGRYRDFTTHLRHGFLFSNSVFKQIDFPGAIETFARRINDRGQIVGGYIADATDRLHGYMLDEGGNFTKIDFPDSIETFASGINNNGVIVGFYVDSGNIVHGFLLANGAYVAVPLPGVPQNLCVGSTCSTTDQVNFNIGISDITDNGLITGDFMTADGNFHGFLGTFESGL